MTLKSATYNVFQVKPLLQPNEGGKSACVYQIPKPEVAIATDNTNFSELVPSTLQQCTGSNRIKPSQKTFRLLPMKCYSASPRCIFIKTFQHFESGLFSLSFVRKPPSRSTWPMALTSLFLATPQWISRMPAEHMDSVSTPSIVKQASSDLVAKASFF